jgi:hypothetical protein
VLDLQESHRAAAGLRVSSDLHLNARSKIERQESIANPVFCGLSLELSARSVINNETVLPKAAVTAGKMILRLNLSVASAALRDARQRYLWKGEW